jgi:hypothetical protein
MKAPEIWLAAIVTIGCEWPGAIVAGEGSKPLTPPEARKKVGEDIVVEMTVKAAKDRLEKRGEVYLDSELDFRSEKNFACVINRGGAGLFQNQGVSDFEAHFRNHTIRVKGRVTVVEDVPRIEISEPEQVEFVKTN